MALRLALFGGSFDPPHLGHLAFARAAADAIQPDEFRWLPAGRQWQKSAQLMAPGAHRQAMIELLIDGEHGFSTDDRELRRSGPSFTVHTLNEFHKEFPGVQLYFLLGQDQYANLHTWFQAERVTELATLVVVPRAGLPVEPPPLLPSHPVMVLRMPDTPISSTAVRAMVRAGEDITPLVGPEVAGYIARHSLYTQL